MLNEGNENEVKRLIDNGANIKHKNQDGNSAIILAAKHGKN